MSTEILKLEPGGAGLHEITERVAAAVAASGIARRPLHSCFCSTPPPASPSRRTPIPRPAATSRTGSIGWCRRGTPLFTHTEEGPDDMPSHIKAALTATSLSIPVIDGRLALGTWQGIFLWEHRRRPRPRTAGGPRRA